jgi:hypothetical protein
MPSTERSRTWLWAPRALVAASSGCEALGDAVIEYVPVVAISPPAIAAALRNPLADMSSPLTRLDPCLPPRETVVG